ncbi:MAG: hypothetical protein U0821_10500 [Chloroflexota bacterium]
MRTSVTVERVDGAVFRGATLRSVDHSSSIFKPGLLGPPGPVSHTTKTTSPDGSTSERTFTKFPDGGVAITAKETKIDGSSSSSGSLGGGSGGKTETNDRAWKDSEGDAMYEHESTTTHADGSTSSERDVLVQRADGSMSHSSSSVAKDGTVTIKVTTTDATGNGTSHVTIIAPDGTVIFDGIFPVPPSPAAGATPPPASSTPSSSDDGSDGDGGNDDGGDGEDEDEDEDGDDDGGDDGGDDDGGDDDGDDGGDEPIDDGARDWDGADEGPPSIFPDRTANVWAVLHDARFADTSDSDDPIGDRIAAALRDRTEDLLGQVDDLGWGEGGGSESPPELKLSPGSVLALMSVPQTTEDWGDWNDPRVHVGYAARLVESVIHSGGVDLRIGARAAGHVARLGSLVSRTYVRA